MESVHYANQAVLCYDQVLRLHEVMESAIPIHGRGNFPTLEIKLKELVVLVNRKLELANINVRDVRINGGAASFILGTDTSQTYNDLDLIFGVHLTSPSDLQKIKTAVLDSLLDFLPDGVNKDKMSSCSMKEAYVQKMVKVCSDTDKWSLISLSNNKGKNVELKFVDTIKRQFEFSVDSFQILLDTLLKFYEVSSTPMTEHFYPTVTAISVFGDYEEALNHLNHKIIATRNPEEIRGGGLFKYCYLLVKNYTPSDTIHTGTLQRYMCSRFFIDFPDITQQKQKLNNYLANHFGADDTTMVAYLQRLHQVVNESTVCLMSHERHQTLGLIQQISYEILWKQEYKAQCKQYQMQQFDLENGGLVLDTTYYTDYPLYDACNNLIVSKPNPYLSYSAYPSPFVTTKCPTCTSNSSYLTCTG